MVQIIDYTSSAAQGVYSQYKAAQRARYTSLHKTTQLKVHVLIYIFIQHQRCTK